MFLEDEFGVKPGFNEWNTVMILPCYCVHRATRQWQDFFSNAYVVLRDRSLFMWGGGGDFFGFSMKEKT